MQAKWNGRGLSVRHNRPRQPLLGREVLGQGDRKHSVAPAWKEVRRLPKIGTAWLDSVVHPYRNVKRLIRVSVEVTDENRPAAIGVVVPAFKRTGDATPKSALRLAWQLLIGDVARRGEGDNEPGDECRRLHDGPVGRVLRPPTSPTVSVSRDEADPAHAMEVIVSG